MKVTICHPGTQYSQYLATQLNNRDLLQTLHTGIAFGYDHLIVKLLKFLPSKIGKKAEARIIRTLPDNKIKRNIFSELKSLYKIKRGANSEFVYYKRNKKFQERITDAELTKSDIVIGFDTSSWVLAERCKKLNIPFILDVSIGHPIPKNTIYTSLSKKYPNWNNQILIKEKKLLEIEQLEDELALHIVAPSSFVKETFVQNGIEANKISVNPFGTYISYFEFHEKKHSKKIKFLFFGGLTVRKGLPFLLSTWEANNFKNAELTIAGFGKLPDNFELPKNVKNLGKISLDDRNKLFKEHDVFVFPSNFEGFAQVQIEAAACGLPIISTPNAGGTEIVTDGFNGFLIEPENEFMLANTIRRFIEDINVLNQMSFNQKSIIKDFTWDAYGDRWVEILNNVLSFELN